jgi:hypothetical protein
MTIRKASFFATTVAVLSLVASTVAAQDFSFRPFSDVTNVCPTCEAPPSDVLKLRDGREVRATVVAMNPSFYTVVRFGEVRTVPRGEVQSVTWEKGSQPSGLDNLDQIVLRNGHVLTGSIVVDNDTPAYYQIKSSYMEYTYTVFKTQAARVFRNGQAQ